MIRVLSGCLLGVEGFPIDVEVDVRPGLPGFEIVGLPSASVKESRARVRSAVRNSGYQFPTKKVVVNLAPADAKKDGSLFDLAIALAILVHQGELPSQNLRNMLIAGELSLGGEIRPISGVLALARLARQHGWSIVVPSGNAEQAAFINDLKVIPVNTLREAVEILNGRNYCARITPPKYEGFAHEPVQEQIKGQQTAKRALQIAAAGRHHILLVGPPGVGKTLLARTAPALLPPMTKDEAIEVTAIYSAAGMADTSLIQYRPVRIPHHSATRTAVLGGGAHPRPGEISLAHRGLLILDELPEFSSDVLQALREPLDQKQIHISRAGYRVTFPADCWIVATANPCPCGYFGSNTKDCRCSSAELSRYQRKLRGPLLDRFDIFCQLDAVTTAELQYAEEIPWYTKKAALNGKARPHDLPIDTAAGQMLLAAQERLRLSVRGYHKTIKVARTIAYLDNAACIQAPHVAEALQYRHQRVASLS